MRADVLLLREGRGSPTASHLYGCAVPPRLAAEIEPGQIVALHLGDRATVGIVWALDASDDAVAASADGDAPEQAEPGEVRDILLREPLVREPQRALAEWIANRYAAPLAAAARLFLPPGLSAGVRTVLRPQPEQPDVAEAETETPERAGDAASLLGMLRERGRLEMRDVDAALGSQRARAAIGALLASDQVTQQAELAPRLEGTRRVRQARLTGTPDALEAWRAEARARLDALPPAPKRRRPTWQTISTEERQAERILRQLAVLDLLSRAQAESGVWGVEVLQKVTRVTPGALDELARAGLLAVETVALRHDPLAGRTVLRTTPLALSPFQSDALEQILAQPSPEREGHVLLLHGITGSGKTEVYLAGAGGVHRRWAARHRAGAGDRADPAGNGAFRGTLSGRVALLHSGLTDAERLDEWRRIRGARWMSCSARARRSSRLSSDLGLIVVDEEHEGGVQGGAHAHVLTRARSPCGWARSPARRSCWAARRPLWSPTGGRAGRVSVAGATRARAHRLASGQDAASLTPAHL